MPSCTPPNRAVAIASVTDATPKTGPEIRLLPSHVIDHIAAGEVVERPASVVKELVENALDAGATGVTVTLRGGGLEHVAVTDNGCGMSPEQARLCLRRHATSKLTCTDDLFRIATLGFRGEALSSIASVSRMRVVTRPAFAAMGYEICVEGGDIVREGPVGSPYGTQMVIDDLFFNTPARRKFMRAPATEQTHILEAVKRVALGARRGGVCVTHGARRLLDIPEGPQCAQRVRSVLGRQVSEVSPFETRVGDVHATGFVGVGQGERHDARNLWLFVNGRFVRDRHLARAVVEAVAQRTWAGPAVVVAYIDLPPGLVDVNVHPQKLEVRFADGRDVFAALAAGVAQGVQALAGVVPIEGPDRALQARDPAEALAARRMLHRASSPNREAGYQAYPVSSKSSDEGRAGEAPWGAAMWDAAPPNAATPHAAVSRDAQAWPLGAGYLLHRTPEYTLVIHAPTLVRTRALRLWYDEVSAGRPRRHGLLLPTPLDGHALWQAWLAEASAELAMFGFDIAPIGPGRFLTRAVPAALAWGRPDDVTRRFIESAHRHLGAAAAGPFCPLAPPKLAALLASCVDALDVAGADAWVAAHMADLPWSSMGQEDGVVRVTPPVLQTLFAAKTTVRSRAC